MKLFFLTLAVIMASQLAYSQNVGFTYQAVAIDQTKAETLGRDSRGEILVNQPISLRFSIRENDADGPIVYTETHDTATDIFGIFRLVIGRGYDVSGTPLANLNWGETPYFLQVEIDLGKGFSLMGIEELLGSPYSLNKKKQLLSIQQNSISISDGNQIQLNDNDATNELIQKFELNGPVLTIADGGNERSIDLSGLTVNESLVDQYVSNNGFITAEQDGSVTNEIQSLSTSGEAGIVSISQGNSIQINVNDADADATNELINDFKLEGSNLSLTDARGTRVVNLSSAIGDDGLLQDEIQDLQLNGHELRITNNPSATSIDLSAYANSLDESEVDQMVANNGYLTTEADASVTNEIQDLNLTGNTLTITNNATATSIDLSTYRNVFERSNGVISNQNGDYANDDFVFGSPQLGNDGNNAHRTRMFFDKSKGAFRAGYVDGSQWDEANVGNFSVGIGRNVVASYPQSIAIGNNSSALGETSIALGEEASTEGHWSVAVGPSASAAGGSSVALGYNAEAGHSYATAIGYQSRALAEMSFAAGYESSAEGYRTTAIGYRTIGGLGGGSYSVSLGMHTTSTHDNVAVGYGSSASGYRSFASGVYGQTIGYYSSALGFGSIASAIGETAVGRYNTADAISFPSFTSPTNRIFVVGNGSTSTTRSDAFVIRQNGSATLNGTLTIDSDNIMGPGEPFTLPGQDGNASQVLTTDGNGNVSWQNGASTLTEADVDNLVSNNGYLTNEVDGSVTNEIQDLSFTGNMLSITNNATATNIDLSSYQNLFERTNGVISNENGDYATDDFVFGSPMLNNNFNPNYSSRFFFDKSSAAFRAGYTLGDRWNTANIGFASAAFGESTRAQGNNSFAAGNSTSAYGNSSFVSGNGSVAYGESAIALGRFARAFSLSEVALGSYNTEYAVSANGTTNWDPSDRLFVVGNGTSSAIGSLSDALIMLKNGNTRLHGQLTIDADNVNGAGESYTLPGQDGSANQVLTTDGNGSVTWQNFPSPITEADVDNFASNNGYLTSEVDGSVTNEIQDLNLSSNILSITNNATATSVDLSTYVNIFESTNGVISNENGNYATDDFVIGSPTLEYQNVGQYNTRMFFDKSKGAFRVGYHDNNSWDDQSRGLYSFGIGRSTRATGQLSFAAGFGSTASNTASFAAGSSTIASGSASFAINQTTTASGRASSAFGEGTRAIGEKSLAAGTLSQATGESSVAFGFQSIASGTNSLAAGNESVASGTHAIALGWSASASGFGSASIGSFNSADGQRSCAVGEYAAANGHESVAIMGTTNGNSSVSIAGTANGRFSLAIGGYAVGQSSTALANATSDGQNSFAAQFAYARGPFSTAIGYNSLTSGAAGYGIAVGFQAQCLGPYGISLGINSIVSGNSASALGVGLVARSYGETVVGLYNTDYVPSSSPTDRAFTVGNGTSTTRSDALIILKNGNTRLHGQLTIDADNVNGAGEAYTLPGQDGNANQVLTTDGNGNVSWSSTDNSATNEIQDLILSGNTLSLTNNPAASDIDLSGYTNIFETSSNVTTNVNGNYATDSFVFGSPLLNDDGNQNHDNRFLFDKSNGAFRAGSAEDNHWDVANRGANSTALGSNNVAPGEFAFAAGRNNLAYSASSVAIGTNNQAEGYNSVAIGRNVATTGTHSMALSLYSAARSYGETTMGIYASDYIPNSTTDFEANDRLFTIGNGLDAGNRSNALVIFKNGDATLLGTLTDASDIRLKRNISNLTNSLPTLLSLRGVHYKWNGIKPQDTVALQTGFIAQEVEQLLPELVKTDVDGFKSINYIGLIPHLVEAIKDLKAENEKLRMEVNKKMLSEKDLLELNSRLEAIEAKLLKQTLANAEAAHK